MNRISTILQVGFKILRLKTLNLTSKSQPLPGGVLDKQIALLRQLKVLLGEPLLKDVPLLASRLGFEASMGTFKAVGGLYEKVHAIRDLPIPGPAGELPARLYLPDDQPGHPLLVYLHGGGWVIGSLSTCDNMARFLCRHAGCAVLSVEYRLAPEFPFPAAVEDSLAAVRWAGEHAAELGGDPLRLLVGGDSAGATLSAVVAQLVRGTGPSLVGQVLICPPTDASNLDTRSYREFGEGNYGLPRADMAWFYDQYAPSPQDRRDPRLSPLLADDLHGVCPAIVVTAEFDVLRDEGEAYASRLQAVGVPVKHIRGNGMNHDYPLTAGLVRRATLGALEIAAEVRKLTG